MIIIRCRPATSWNLICGDNLLRLKRMGTWEVNTAAFLRYGTTVSGSRNETRSIPMSLQDITCIAQGHDALQPSIQAPCCNIASDLVRLVWVKTELPAGNAGQIAVVGRNQNRIMPIYYVGARAALLHDLVILRVLSAKGAFCQPRDCSPSHPMTGHVNRCLRLQQV